jgi:hypothetical protein
MPHRRFRSHTQEHATTIDKTQEARFRVCRPDDGIDARRRLDGVTARTYEVSADGITVTRSAAPAGRRRVSAQYGTRAPRPRPATARPTRRVRRAAIDPVEQPLTADATVPVTVEFAGDDGYNAAHPTAPGVDVVVASTTGARCLMPG